VVEANGSLISDVGLAFSGNVIAESLLVGLTLLYPFGVVSMEAQSSGMVTRGALLTATLLTEEAEGADTEGVKAGGDPELEFTVTGEEEDEEAAESGARDDDLTAPSVDEEM